MPFEKLRSMIRKITSGRPSGTKIAPSKKFTIISNSIAAKNIYDAMHMDYLSPTIGTYISDSDFLEFIKDVPFYTSCKLTDAGRSDNNCPMGVLSPEDRLHKPVTVVFTDSSSFSEAADSWHARCRSMDMENISIVWEFLDDKYDCSWFLSMFSALPGNTIALTRKQHPELRNCCCITDENTGVCDLNRFDYVSFLNRTMDIKPLPESEMSQSQLDFLRQINGVRWKTSLRARNKNTNPTIITGNCLAGFIYNNLGLRFNSPTINLWLYNHEYLILAQNLRAYADSTLEEVPDAGMGYPVGKLLPTDSSLPALTLFFQHYHSFEEARAKWFERYARINYDNIYFIQDFYNIRWPMDDIFEQFNALPGKKMALLHKPDSRFDNAHVLTCGPSDGSEFRDGYIFEYDGTTGKRHMDNFDYVSFLNEP